MLVAAVALLATPIGHAADPLSYTVTISSTGNAALDTAIKASSQLKSLESSGPIAPFVLVGRAQQDVNRLHTVLEGFGYYQGKVAMTVDGRALDDPDLPAAIEVLPKDKLAAVSITLDAGPLYHIRQVAIDGEMPDEARNTLGISTGEPAVASEILKAQVRLLAALQEDGYAQATVDAPVATEDPDAQVLDLTFKVHAGPRVDIGEIRLTGLHGVNESLVRNRLLVHTGERYSPTRIEKARLDLLSLGVFSAITVHAADQLDSLGRIALVFDLQERLRHTVGFTAAYSTDLGGSARTTWSHRNLLGNAEQLNLTAGVNGLGGTATTGLGYIGSVQLIKPDFRLRDQSLAINAGALKQQLDAYGQDEVSAGISLNRKFSDVWSASVGVSTSQERILQEMVARNYTLVGLPASATYNSTGLVNPLDDPVRGIRATLAVTPTESFGPPNATFVIAQGNASSYIDLASLGWTASGRSVLALRALVGSAWGASQFSLPPNQRFYGGGSATVRGFRYQSIGPQFADNKPIGGTSIDTATVEFRQRLFGDFGAAMFVDAGQVSASSTPLQGTAHVGAGIGVRYYTVIGPIRFDLAAPVNKQPGGDSFEIYIGLAQAF